MKNKYNKENGKSKIIGDLVIIVGLILIASSLFLLNQSIMRDNVQKDKNISKVKEFKSEREQNRDQITNDTPETIKARMVESTDMVGYISIYKINLVLPIYNGTDEAVLRKGVGVMPELDKLTGMNGKTTVLAGHRGGYQGQNSFRYIDYLNIEDKFVVGTKNSDMEYRVIDKMVIEPDDWSKFERKAGKSLVVLLTCHPYPKNDKRLLVIGERIK